MKVIDNDKTEIVESNEEILQTNQYWDYFERNLTNVDFDELISINAILKDEYRPMVLI